MLILAFLSGFGLCALFAVSMLHYSAWKLKKHNEWLAHTRRLVDGGVSHAENWTRRLPGGDMIPEQRPDWY